MSKLVKIFLTNTILFTSSLVFGQSLVYENYSTVLNSNLRETKILLNVPNIVYKEIKQDGKTFIRFEEQDFPLLYEIGKPELPFFTTFVAIPAKAGVDLQVKANYTETIKNVVVFPSQNKEINEREGSYGVRNFDYDTNFYEQKTEIFPEENGNVSEPMILRNLRVVALRVYPFTYNPKLKQLEIAKQLEITLDYTSANPTNTLETEPTTVSKAFDELYKNTVINYQTLGTQTAPVSYYVIYAPLSSHTTLQPLVDWKNQKGVKTTLVDLGTIANSTALKTDITNRYNSPTPPDYVLIVGDESVTSAYKETYTPDPEPSPGAGSLPGNYSNDNYFVTVSGTDYFPDIFGSRIPISSSGATNLTKIQRAVNKVLQYEKTPFTNPNIDWYKRGVVAANDAYVSQKDTKRKVR
ncbi:hypothetical protein IT568_08665, partial [bacterium]|nr:hypothetical protein [bacterium]